MREVMREFSLRFAKVREHEHEQNYLPHDVTASKSELCSFKFEQHSPRLKDIGKSTSIPS